MNAAKSIYQMCTLTKNWSTSPHAYTPHNLIINNYIVLFYLHPQAIKHKGTHEMKRNNLSAHPYSQRINGMHIIQKQTFTIHMESMQRAQQNEVRKPERKSKGTIIYSPFKAMQ